MEIRIEHNGNTYKAMVDGDATVSIYVNSVWAGNGTISAGRIECPAVLDEGAYEAIEAEIASA